MKRPLAFLASLCCAGAAHSQFVVEQLHIERDGVVLRGWSATVDLAHPGLRVIVTGPLDDAPDGVEAMLVPTDAWAEHVGADLAVNANFFGWLDAGGADIKGLCVSNGEIVSPARLVEGTPDPAITFDTDNTASIGRFGPEDLVGVEHAVAGIGPSPSDRTRGALLVDDRENQGSLTRVEPEARHPRTGVGVSRDGLELYVIVIDGRREGWSDGATLTELADLLIGMGAWDAVNLDGGGSSSFLYKKEDAWIENRPSDGEHRPVASHLGFAIVADHPE